MDLFNSDYAVYKIGKDIKRCRKSNVLSVGKFLWLMSLVMPKLSNRFVEGIMAPDGEEQDAYLLGVKKSVDKFTGKIIAIVHRKDDVEEKWIAVPDGITFTKKEIRKQIHFQEQYFDSDILM